MRRNDKYGLAAVDAVMDVDVNGLIDEFISGSLIEQGYDPDLLDLPLEVTIPLEAEAINVMIANYEGLVPFCEILADWTQQVDGMCAELLALGAASAGVAETGVAGVSGSMAVPVVCVGGTTAEEEEFETVHTNVAENVPGVLAEGVVKGAVAAPTTPTHYLIEGLCMILSQEFTSEPFKKIMAHPNHAWAPPPYYFTLLKNNTVVATMKKIYERNRGSEFLSAFLQDCVDRTEIVKVPIRHRFPLRDVTAHFPIFVRAFSDLLVEFMTKEDEAFNDLDPRHISKLLCHAENSYVYAQALLHFMPYHQPKFVTCRRLRQIIYRYLRVSRHEYAAADRMLLCTTLPNYPTLFRIFKRLEKTVDLNGRMTLTPEIVDQLSSILGRVMRRFEKHKTLLLFHDTGNELPSVGAGALAGGEEEDGEVEPMFDVSPFNWEKEMLGEQVVNHLGTGRPPPDSDAMSAKIEWPVAAAVRNKNPLPVLWDLPSASQIGDSELILDDIADENDRRGSTKLNLPPVEAIRETDLPSLLLECLVYPEVQTLFMKIPPGKLVELILMLTTLSEYELVVLHLQNEQSEKDDVASRLPDGFDQHTMHMSGGDAFRRDLEKTEGGGLGQGHGKIANARLPAGARRKRPAHHPTNSLVVPEEQHNNPKSKRSRVGSCVSSYIDKSVVPSVLESSVYFDPHEGSKLRACVPDDADQSSRLKAMFDTCSISVKKYKKLASEELYEIFRLVREPDAGLSDLNLLQLLQRTKSSVGASAALRRIEVLLLPSECARGMNAYGDYLCEAPEYPEDPILAVSDAVITVLLTIALWHPRKRIVVVSLFRRLLLRSLSTSCAATDRTHQRRRCVMSAALCQLGWDDTLTVDNGPTVPWAAAVADWTTSYVPGYKMVFDMIHDLVPVFEISLLREAFNFIAHACSTPFSIDFATRLARLLRRVVRQSHVDLSLPVNDVLRESLACLVSGVYTAWIPGYPPEEILTHCKTVGEVVRLQPSIMQSILDDLAWRQQAASDEAAAAAAAAEYLPSDEEYGEEEELEDDDEDDENDLSGGTSHSDRSTWLDGEVRDDDEEQTLLLHDDELLYGDDEGLVGLSGGSGGILRRSHDGVSDMDDASG